jgi:hypothetical protein
VVEQVVLERSRRAVDLRDKGKLDEAQSLLKQNAIDIKAYAANAKTPNKELLDLGGRYEALAAQPPPASKSELGEQRKMLRSLQAPAAGAASRY